MAPQMFPRPVWRGTPHEVGQYFVLRKNRREAKAMIFTHPVGWEVRLFVGAQLEPVQTQTCRTQEELCGTAERWKASLMDQGWQ
jgi:hypothetical protein